MQPTNLPATIPVFLYGHRSQLLQRLDAAVTIREDGTCDVDFPRVLEDGTPVHGVRIGALTEPLHVLVDDAHGEGQEPRVEPVE